MERAIARIHPLIRGLSAVVWSLFGAGGRPSSSQAQATHRENPTSQEASSPKEHVGEQTQDQPPSGRHMERAARVPRRRRRPLVVSGGTVEPARFPCEEPLPAIAYREGRHRKPLRAHERVDQHEKGAIRVRGRPGPGASVGPRSGHRAGEPYRHVRFERPQELGLKLILHPLRDGRMARVATDSSGVRVKSFLDAKVVGRVAVGGWGGGRRT